MSHQNQRKRTIVNQKNEMKKSNSKSNKVLQLILTCHQPWDIYGDFIGEFECVYNHSGSKCDCDYPKWYKKELNKELD